LALAIVNKALKQSWKYGCEQTVPEMRREIAALSADAGSGGAWWGAWRSKHGLHATKVRRSFTVHPYGGHAGHQVET
jgi:hypothetical protein